MFRTKNVIGLNREITRNKLRDSRIISKEFSLNEARGIKWEDTETADISENTLTSREQMLKKWKAERELKKKDRELKKPAFIVRAASKIPSTVPLKFNRNISLQKTSFSKTLLHPKTCENISDPQRVLSQKQIPKITTTLAKPTLQAKKSEEKILKVPVSRKMIPKSNLPTVKTSLTSNTTLASSLKPKESEKNKVNFSNIPKTNFHKAAPKVFLFGNKNTEKTAIKSKFDKNKTKTHLVNQSTLLPPCNISHIEPLVDHQKTQNLEDTLQTPTPKIKIRTSTPLKESDMNVQKSSKNEPDTLALLENVSSTIQHSSLSEKDSNIAKQLDERCTETSSENNKNNSLENKEQLHITKSLNEEFEKLKVEEIKNCERQNTEIDIKDSTATPLHNPKTPKSNIKILQTGNSTPRRSQRLIEKNEKLNSIKKLPQLTTPSKIGTVEKKSCNKETPQLDNTNKSSERVESKEDSCEDLRTMPRPSLMGKLSTDDSLESPAAAASYDFDNLEKEGHVFEKKTDKKSIKVSLLYDPDRRVTRFTSIKEDLMSFSSPE